jgi:hypothetical protein
MHEILIRARVNSHGFYPQLLAGAQNTQGYFAAVGNNDFIKQWHRFLPAAFRRL